MRSPVAAASRVVMFGWLVLHGKILNMDNLRRGKIVANACPMCLDDEENLLLKCRKVQMLWDLVIGWFGWCWILPNSIQDLLESGKSPIGSRRGKEK